MTKLCKLLFLILFFCISSAFAAISQDMLLVPLKMPREDAKKSSKLYPGVYHEEDFLLAYHVFRLGRNAELAYEVAKEAVLAEPDNFSWRKKLLHSALLSEHQHVALHELEWLFLHDEKKREAYFKKALSLAATLEDTDLAARLLEQKRKVGRNESFQYGLALKEQGYPRKALKWLRDIEGALTERSSLEALAEIAVSVGKFNLASEYFSRLSKKNELNENTVLEWAKLSYTRGQNQEAFLRMKSWRQTHANGSSHFLHQYADLAILEEAYTEAMMAWRELFHDHRLYEKNIEKLLLLERMLGKKEFAYEDAKRAWERTKKPQFLAMAFEEGQSLHAWKDMKTFFSTIPESARLHAEAHLSHGIHNIQQETLLKGYFQEFSEKLAFFYYRLLSKKSEQKEIASNDKPKREKRLFSRLSRVPLTEIAKNSLCLDVRCRQEIF